jgi:hypothetical protein
MNENLIAFKKQHYKNYEIIAVIDNKKDQAAPYLRAAGLKYIIADKKATKGSGKVNAIATAIRKFRNYEIYVIADSDILVKNNWLSEIVAPFSDKRTGLSTSYPYFRPEAGFWSRVKMVWCFVGDGMMESKILRFGWGGSLAFRNEMLGKREFEHFRNSLSDDVAISAIVRSKGLKLVYVKSAQPVVRVVDDFKAFWEWSNRQTALSLLGSDLVFWIGLPYYIMNFLLLLSAILLTVFYSHAAALLFIPIALGTLKSYERLKDKCPDFLVINTLMPLLFIANLLVAKNMKIIRWRSRSYRLIK